MLWTVPVCLVKTMKRKYTKGGCNDYYLREYSELHDEMNKILNSEDPYENWLNAQAKCLRNFEYSSIGLQTVCWYTIVRVHVAGLCGMNDGLFIIDELIRNNPNFYRTSYLKIQTELLNEFVNDLQNAFESLKLNGCHDLNALYVSEQILTELCSCLERAGTEEPGNLESFREQVRFAITRLEKPGLLRP